MTGNFTLFADLHGKFFTDKQEPQQWDDDFAKLYANYFDGAKLPIKPLDYYYNKELKSRNRIRMLDSVRSFIDDDPHIGNKALFFDVTKTKPKLITIDKNGDVDAPKAIKHKIVKKRKTKKTIRTIGIKRI